MTTIACVLYQGGMDQPLHSRGTFSELWVERLYRGIKRNTTRPFRFVCFVDKDYEFNEPIEQVRFKLAYRNMLSLLEPYSEDLGRVVFMGLDTVITGNIDSLMDYDGPFAMLRDPIFPERLCSGVTAFPHMPSIWEAVLKAHEEGSLGSHKMGAHMSDMIFLNTQNPVALDDTGIYSYKAHIKKNPALLKDARIIYFHGKEKPHELCDPWIDEHWGGPLEIKTGSFNTPIATMFTNAVHNLKRDLKRVRETPAHGSRAIIVGGGPSLEHTYPDISKLGGTVFALNGAHDYLIARGVPVHYHVLLDAKQSNVVFVKHPRSYVTYLLAAQCHPDVFDALKYENVITWISCFDNEQRDQMLAKEFSKQTLMLVGGGATVGLKALNLAYLMGYRTFDIFGFDACYRGEENHAYRQSMNDGEERIVVTAAGRQFICAPWMAKQAVEFQKQMRQLLDERCNFTVHGDGLISWVCKQWEHSTT